MANNLRNRLQRIRESNPLNSEKKDRNEIDTPGKISSVIEPGFSPGSGWNPAGYQVLKRRVQTKLDFTLPRTFPNSLAVIIRDLFQYGSIPNPGALAFFDLETTGLSGGAGTAAFLGSFGRFDKSEKNCLVIDQYLLLDYPGEGDFLELLKKEILQPGEKETPRLIVSYNGKAFDSQILKNRCLMNSIIPPDYFHADLLHPSRRLWKQMLPDCSQATIETMILGLDRAGDIPGALAPEIWFSFLKTGETFPLMGICDHNIRDIKGLASLFLLLSNIAAFPLETLETFTYDLEALALLWREALLRESVLCRRYHSEKKFFREKEKETARIILNTAAQRLMPRALYVQGMDLLKSDKEEQGRSILLTLANSVPGASVNQRAAAYRVLAMDAEWSMRDPHCALEYAEAALSLSEIKNEIRNELERRRERLLKKCSS